MSDERYEKRAAYVVAKARHRAFAERYGVPIGLGAREALTMTDEARIELIRLEAAMTEAEQAWRASVSPAASKPAAEESAG